MAWYEDAMYTAQRVVGVAKGTLERSIFYYHQMMACMMADNEMGWTLEAVERIVGLSKEKERLQQQYEADQEGTVESFARMEEVLQGMFEGGGMNRGEDQSLVQVGRNAACPCGSGNKYKTRRSQG